MYTDVVLAKVAELSGENLKAVGVSGTVCENVHVPEVVPVTIKVYVPPSSILLKVMAPQLAEVY